MTPLVKEKRLTEAGALIIIYCSAIRLQI